ncbi:MAG TPA: TIGR04438 family Trp-rich protein [Burkholderiaceae bacterium]|jgi:small Trp-rich protein
MGFVVIGALLIALKLLGFGPFGALSWWWVLSPFALAIAWWTWSDASGLSAKKAMQRVEDRKTRRREEQMVKLGIDPKKGKK